MENKLNRVNCLDTFRLCSIFIIIISHFEFLKETNFGDVYWKHFRNATFGVDYFFLLSGFGLYISCKKNHNNIDSCFKFAFGKIKKIYPAYIFSIFCMLPFQYLQSHSIYKLIISFFLTSTMTQSLFGYTGISHLLNSVCWFCSCLFIIYLLTPLLFKLIEKIKTIKQIVFALLSTVFIILVLSKLFISIENNIVLMVNKHFDDFFYGSPYIRIFYVFLGMLISKLVMEIKKSNLILECKKFTYLEVFVFLLFVIFFYFRNTLFIDKSVFLRAIDIVIVSSFVFIFSLNTGLISRFFDNEKISSFARQNVMYYYLFHYPIRLYINKFVSFNTDNKKILECILIIILTIIITELFKLVEENLIKKEIRNEC